MDIENKLIAEFMGYEFIDGEFKIPHSDKTRNSDFSEWCSTYGDIDGMFSVGYLLAPSNLMYHSDWNWLMEVVEKIESIVLEEVNDTSFNVTIGATRYCVIQDNNGGMLEVIGEGKTKIESTYKAVVQFIKWYNEQK